MLATKMTKGASRHSGVPDNIETELLTMSLRLKDLDSVQIQKVEETLTEDEEDIERKYFDKKKENASLKVTYLKLLSSKKEGCTRINHLEDDVFSLRWKFDMAKSLREKLSKDLKDKDGELQVLYAKNHRKRELGKKKAQIRRLENNLDKTIIKYNESLCIKETYLKILQRLQRERMGFDNQLLSIERTLKSKVHDYAELRQMFHEANYLKEMSKNSLKNAKDEFVSIKKLKDKELHEKKKYVNNRLELTTKISKRETLREKMQLKASGHLDSDEEKKLQKAQFLNHFSDLKNDSALEKKQSNLNELEGIWRKIKEVTGVSTSKNIISKFFSSKDTFKNLQSISKKAQKKITKLGNRLIETKEELENYKYSQSSGNGNKRVIDEFLQQLGESKSILEKRKREFEKNKSIMVNIKCGLEHLHEKLILLSPEKEEEEKEGVVEESDEEDDKKNIMNLIERSCQILKDVNWEQIIKDTKSDVSGFDVKNFKISEHNFRLEIKKEDDSALDDSREEDYEDIDILDRKQLKKLATLAFQKHKSKLKQSEEERKESKETTKSVQQELDKTL